MHPHFPPRGPDPFMHGPRPGMGPGPGPGMDHGPGFGPRPRFPPGPNGPLPGPMPGPPDGPFLPPSKILCGSALLSVMVTVVVIFFCYRDKPPEIEIIHSFIMESWSLLGGWNKCLMYDQSKCWVF